MSKLRILDTHVSTVVSNFNESKNYLENTLLLKPLRVLTRPGQGPVAWYPGLEICQAALGESPGLLRHVAWQVDGIDDAIRVLKEAGCRFESVGPREIDIDNLDTKELVRFIFFETPLGFRGELYEVNPRTALPS